MNQLADYVPPYKPRAGSKTERAVEEIRAKGPQACGPLSDLLDCDGSDVLAFLATPIAKGLVRKVHVDGLLHFELVASPRPPARDPSVKQTVVPANGKWVKQTVVPANGKWATSQVELRQPVERAKNAATQRAVEAIPLQQAKEIADQHIGPAPGYGRYAKPATVVPRETIALTEADVRRIVRETLAEAITRIFTP